MSESNLNLGMKLFFILNVNKKYDCLFKCRKKEKYVYKLKLNLCYLKRVKIKMDNEF